MPTITSSSLSKSNSRHRPDKAKRGRHSSEAAAADQAPADKRGKQKSVPFPTKEQVLAFIQEQEIPVGKREIARAFHLRGADRIPLKALLKELESDGEIDRGHGRRLARKGALPEVTMIEVIGADEDGDLWAKPVDFRPDDVEPRILIIDNKRTDRPLAGGDRILARLERKDADLYEAHPIRRLEHHAQRVVGLFERGRDGGGRIIPTDKRIKTEFSVAPQDIGQARAGDIVIAAVETRRLGTPRARVLEKVGRLGEAKSISLISIVEHGIPMDFPSAAVALAEDAKGAPLGSRTDLRDVPLVTIDGDDARDFDDAVFARPDDNPDNPGGWRLLVAIADVAYYVRDDDALDKTARQRGNSVYFPDRVVPMLPEALSNGWCSLKPHEERPCMAVEMVIDAEGKKLHHQFMRGLMRSAARLTYEQAQRAMDGITDDVTAPILDAVIRPLYGAFRALLIAREHRGTLELDIAERRVFINEAGQVDRIVPRMRLDSHRLIEEFMIAANVAAAESLERRKQPCMYRVHESPDPARVDALREFLRGLHFSLPKGQVIRPKHFTGLLQKAAGTPYAGMINTLVLRSQAQAVYAPENLGHFGLALQRYAHFTSPIRRYADLLVHRSLIKAYGFGEDGLAPGTEAEFSDIGDHISATERRAAAAEREAIDRYTAAYLSAHVGEVFAGRISSVTRFGLFISLNDSGADGLVPISSLPSDFYDHDERGHALVGRRWGRVYQLGAQVEVRLLVCTPLTGGITLEIVGGGKIAAPADQSPADHPPGSTSGGAPGRHTGAPKHAGGPGTTPRSMKRSSLKSGSTKSGRSKSRSKTAGTEGRTGGGTASTDHPAASKRKPHKRPRR